MIVDFIILCLKFIGLLFIVNFCLGIIFTLIEAFFLQKKIVLNQSNLYVILIIIIFLSSIVLNDWNNGYSNKNTPLAKRFSDEFERGFHLAGENERGRTENITIIDDTKSFLTWERDKNNPDVVQVRLRNKLAPQQKIVLSLTYQVKIPSDRFTKFGYGKDGIMNLKN